MLELLAADADVDAIIALVLPTGATGDLVAAIQDADIAIPLAAVVLNQPEAVRLIEARNGKIPAYGYPEAAAGAVARAARYGAWRAEPRGQIPVFPEILTDQARGLIREFLGHVPGGGWLPPGETAELLRCYGIPLTGTCPGSSACATTRTCGKPTRNAPLPDLAHPRPPGRPRPRAGPEDQPQLALEEHVPHLLAAAVLPASTR